MALMIGDANYHATPIGWMPLFAAILLIVFAYIYVSIAQNAVKYSQQTQDAHCARGDEVPFSIEFTNSSLLVLPNVQAELFVSDADGNAARTSTTSLSLGPHGKCEVPLEVRLEHIGVFQVGLKQLVMGDFLGLFTRKVPSKKENLFCVMPKVPDLGSIEFSDDSEVENFKMLKTALADSLDYAYVREYELGDPLKTIHWNLSAKTGQYYTRLFEKTVSPGVIVVMDLDVPATDTEEFMEMRDTVIESALAIAEYARKRGLETEIRYVNRQGMQRQMHEWDSGAVLELIREMPHRNNNFDAKSCKLELLHGLAVDVRSQNNVIICSADVHEDMVGATIALKQHRKNPFFVVAVPHRLVDRDLERHLTPLSALSNYQIRYQHVSASNELSGRDL